VPKCDVCGEEFPESQLLRCYDCGKAYCPRCAEKDPTIKELGVCPDCEEVFEDEEDEWGWE
jgi:DNA-directed RNA polymerase subunit H (RpoH/RPB5)